MITKKDFQGNDEFVSIWLDWNGNSLLMLMLLQESVLEYLIDRERKRKGGDLGIYDFFRVMSLVLGYVRSVHDILFANVHPVSSSHLCIRRKRVAFHNPSHLILP